MADTTRIGELRWPVWLMTRQQAAQINGPGITETPIEIGRMHAKIEAARPLTFYAARQTDTPFTHMIVVRWLDYLDNTHAFVRQTRRPTDSAVRTEIFRVRRVLEEGGRKRFLRVEAELEDVSWLVPTPAPPPFPWRVQRVLGLGPGVAMGTTDGAMLAVGPWQPIPFWPQPAGSQLGLGNIGLITEANIGLSAVASLTPPPIPCAFPAIDSNGNALPGTDDPTDAFP